jgi:hypothetical protein
MARTKHHINQKSNHNGHDLWSKRPCSQMTYCSYNKKLTNQIERMQCKELIIKELKLLNE